MTTSVQVESRSGDVKILRLNRPQKRNALDAPQWERLYETVTALAGDPEIRCLVLTGAGSAFASGGDISRFLQEVDEPAGPRKFRQRIRRCLDALHTFPRPTVAMINGPAIGGGLELALACDARVAARSAKLGIPAVKFGFVMAYPDFRRLSSVVGLDYARFLTMTGRIIDAEEGHRVGLIHELTNDKDLEEKTLDLAAELAAGDTQAALWFREAGEFVADPTRSGLSALRAYEEQCLSTDSFRKRVTRFLDRKNN